MANQELITANDFQAKVAGDGTSVVKFGADWCGPCKRYDGEIVPALRKEFGDRVAFYNVDIEDRKNNTGTDASQEMKRIVGNMEGIPHISILRRGVLLGTIEGADLEPIRQKLKEILGGI